MSFSFSLQRRWRSPNIPYRYRTKGFRLRTSLVLSQYPITYSTYPRLLGFFTFKHRWYRTDPISHLMLNGAALTRFILRSSVVGTVPTSHLNSKRTRTHSLFHAPASLVLSVLSPTEPVVKNAVKAIFSRLRYGHHVTYFNICRFCFGCNVGRPRGVNKVLHTTAVIRLRYRRPPTEVGLMLRRRLLCESHTFYSILCALPDETRHRELDAMLFPLH